MPNKGKLLTFDGADWVWKTTLATTLAKESGGVYYKTPGSATAEEREQHDRPGVTVQERFDFYLSKLREDAEKIAEILAGWQNVFCDRFIASTIVHHKSMDESVDISEAEKVLKLVKVDCTIILHASVDTLFDRILARDRQTRFELDRHLVERAQEGFMKYPNATLFDTTHVGPEKTMEIIERHLLANKNI